MRLTKQYYSGATIDQKCDCVASIDLDFYKAIKKKLGQLEDIEEEVGIDLFILLNNVLKNGVYLKDLRGSETITFVRSITLGYHKRWYLEYDYFIYDVKDYGKTWALSKEELE